MDDKIFFLEQMSFERILELAQKLGYPVTDRRWRVPAIAEHLARKRKVTLDIVLDALNREELAAASRPLGISAEGDAGAIRERLREALAGKSVRAVRRGALAETVEEIVALAVEPDSVKVIDGDTIDVRADGKAYRVRLRGIDAPETSAAMGGKAEQDLDRTKLASEEMFAMGAVAAKWLEDRLRGRALFLHVQRTPLGPQEYLHHNQHRLLAYVTLDAPEGPDVGEAMLREGMALVWPRGFKTRRYGHPRGERYVDACHAGLQGQPGLWERGLGRLCPRSEQPNRDWTRMDCAASCQNVTEPAS